jgi:putative FmdB family regulatory protein
MPVYEYRCRQCGRKFSLFLRTLDSQVTVACPRCGSSDASRLVSRVAVMKSEESRLEELADPGSLLSDLDENDPKSVARWMRRMSREIGEDMGPEFEEAIDRIEAGEDPDKVLAGEEAGEAEGSDADSDLL